MAIPLPVDPAVYHAEWQPQVLFIAWQHGRFGYVPDGTFGGFSDLADLRRLDADNTVLLKLNHWISF